MQSSTLCYFIILYYCNFIHLIYQIDCSINRIVNKTIRGFGEIRKKMGERGLNNINTKTRFILSIFVRLENNLTLLDIMIKILCNSSISGLF